MATLKIKDVGFVHVKENVKEILSMVRVVMFLKLTKIDDTSIETTGVETAIVVNSNYVISMVD